MATLSITIPAGDISTTLAAYAGEHQQTADAAGVKALALAVLKQWYVDQKRVEAQRTTAPTVDTAVTTANTNASGIS